MAKPPENTVFDARRDDGLIESKNQTPVPPAWDGLRVIEAQGLLICGSVLLSSRRPDRRLDDYTEKTLEKLARLLAYARSQSYVALLLGDLIHPLSDTPAWFVAKVISVFRHHLLDGGILPRVSAPNTRAVDQGNTLIDILSAAGVVAVLSRQGLSDVLVHQDHPLFALGASGPKAAMPANPLLGSTLTCPVLWCTQGALVSSENPPQPMANVAWVFHASESFPLGESSVFSGPVVGNTQWVNLPPVSRTHPAERFFHPVILDLSRSALTSGSPMIAVPANDPGSLDGDALFDLSGLQASAKQEGDSPAGSSQFAQDLQASLSQQQDPAICSAQILADAQMYMAKFPASATARALFQQLFDRAVFATNATR